MDELSRLAQARPRWHRLAACSGHDNPALWFPERGDDVRPAKAICATCPAAGPCLEWALDQDHNLQGIWAGTSARTRRLLRSVRSAA